MNNGVGVVALVAGLFVVGCDKAGDESAASASASAESKKTESKKAESKKKAEAPSESAAAAKPSAPPPPAAPPEPSVAIPKRNPSVPWAGITLLTKKHGVAGMAEKLSALHPSMVACYRPALNTNPFLGGKTQIEFTVSKAGKVLDAKVTESHYGAAMYSTCMVGTIKARTFPKPESDTKFAISIETKPPPP